MHPWSAARSVESWFIGSSGENTQLEWPISIVTYGLTSSCKLVQAYYGYLEFKSNSESV